MAGELLNLGEVVRALVSDAVPARQPLAEGAPDTTAERMAVAFAQALRIAGMAAPVGSVIMFAEALGAVGLQSRRHVYWAGRAVFIRRPEDLPVYDRVFAAFWMARMVGGEVGPEMVKHITLALDAEDLPEEPGAADDGPRGDTLAVRWSAQEVLRHKDFAEYSTEEFAEARDVMATLRFVGSPRRSRRLVPQRGSRISNRRSVLLIGGRSLDGEHDATHREIR